LLACDHNSRTRSVIFRRQTSFFEKKKNGDSCVCVEGCVSCVWGWGGVSFFCVGFSLALALSLSLFCGSLVRVSVCVVALSLLLFPFVITRPALPPK
jgi:hypothetical protein